MNVVSLFAGCGGLDLGFEQAGFNVIWANEFDESIHETYRLNHPKTVFCGEDIRRIKSEDIPDCDGIIGGPPCQSWSVGGKGKGFEDERGKLFLDYIRIVEDKKPKFFLIENVAGILEEKHKPAFTMFLSRLACAGYNVQYSLLNAADYIIPQDRFRVFIVGIRKDLNVGYTFPDPAENASVTLRQAIGDIIDTPSFSEGEIQSVISEHGFWNHDVYTGPYSENYMHSNRVRSWDEVSFTIQAQASNAPQHPQAPKMVRNATGGRSFKKGYEHLYRRLSVRECARIQTFPDSFHLVYDNVKYGYKMIGNAVPPRMAYYLAMQIKRVLSNNVEVKVGKELLIKNIASRYQSSPIKENTIFQFEHEDLDLEKNVLLGLVKMDNLEFSTNKQDKIYYTGRTFPSCIDLNKLCYFMPYFKNKGIKDLYFIKVIRVGCKKEVYPNSSDEEFRLLFEVRFVKQLFADYIPVRLNIWHTFTDTTLRSILSINEDC